MESALECPLAWAFAQLQSIHRRNGVELAAPDGSEMELIAELEEGKRKNIRPTASRRKSVGKKK